MESLMDCQLTFDKGLENPPTSVTFGSSFMEAIVYTHCKPEVQYFSLTSHHSIINNYRFKKLEI